MTTKSTSSSQSVAETFTSGSKLADSFTLERKISSGETGVVWLARDEEMEQNVALLFLPDALMFDPRALDELRQEVRHNRQLIHPNVVRVYDLIEAPGWAAVSADYHEAETLASLQAKKSNGVFEPTEIDPWLSSLCRTLDDAHRANLLHGDLIPENILLTKPGKILIANFGISRIIRDSINRAQPEKAEKALPCLSPQQLDGERPARWDDIYALGILFHTLLAGQPPFHGADIVQQIRRTPPPLISDRRAGLGIKGAAIPKNWENVVAACLEKHTDKRPKTAHEAGAKLNAPMEPAPASPQPAAPPVSQPKEALGESLPWKEKKPGTGKKQPGEKKPPAEKKAEPEKKPAQPPASIGHLLEKFPASVPKPEGNFPFRIAAIVLAVVGVIALMLHSKKTVPESKPVTIAATPASPVTPKPAAVVAQASPSQPSPQPSKAPVAPPPATPAVVASASPQKSPPLQAPLTVDQARKAFEDAEKTRQEKAKLRQQAEADVQQVQKAIDEKLAAAVQLKKAAGEAAALRKQREEAERKAIADAEAAKKASEQIASLIKEQETAQQKADAEIQELQKAAAEKQRTASEAAKTVSDAEEQLKQQEAAFKKAQDEAAKAALAEKARIDQAADDAAKLASQQKIGIENLTPITPEKSASPNPPDAAQMLVLNQARPQATPAPAPTATPFVANPKSEIDRKLENSLGMKFVPVDDVLFCIWHTRVQDFEAFANETGFKGTSWRQPGYKQGPDHPVVNVTWNDAVAFCKWLTDKEHKSGLLAHDQVYRLPTDLEWSKAVGLAPESGKTPESRDMDVSDVYPWGTQWPPPQGAGNYTGEETGSDVAIKGYDDGYAWTSPVGSFTPNKYGIYDMGGNAWQWCMDWLNGSQKAKVLRGASWYNGGLKLSLLSSCRYQSAPDITTDNFGFRVVIAPDSKSKK